MLLLCGLSFLVRNEEASLLGHGSPSEYERLRVGMAIDLPYRVRQVDARPAMVQGAPPVPRPKRQHMYEYEKEHTHTQAAHGLAS